MKIKFCLLQIIYWCGQGAFIGYLVPLLSQKGLDSFSVGLVMSLYTFVGFFGQLLFGYMCDKLHSIKKVYFFLNIIIIILYITIYINDKDIAFLLVIILGIFQLSMPVLLDSWVMKYYVNTPSTFGPIRSTASFALAIFSFAFGFVVEKIGFISMPIAAVSFFSFAIIIIYYTDDCSGSTVRIKLFESIKQLINNKKFLGVMISCVFLGMAVGAVIQMLYYIVYGVGGDKGSIGIATAIAAFIEVPIMFFYPKFTKISNNNKIIFSCFLYLFCFIVLYIAGNVAMVMVSMLLYGAAYGLLLPSLREFISISINNEIQTSALSVLDAAQNCIGTSIGVYLSGYILANGGIKNMLLLFIICTFMSCILNIYYLKVKK